MKKIKAFFYVLLKSAASLNYYKDVVKTNFGFSMKYFLALSILAAITSASATTLTISGEAKTSIKTFVDGMVNIFPADLTITTKDGKASINQPEPYIIPAPKGPAETAEQANQPENLIVFYSKGTIDDLENYKTLVLVNEKNILVKNSNKIEVYPLSEIPDGEFSKANIQALADLVKPYIELTPYAIAATLLITLIMYYTAFRLVYLLPVALILLLIGKIHKLKYDFPKYYQVGIHTLTLPLIVDVITTATKIQIPLSLWFFASNTLLGIIVLITLAKDQTPRAVDQTKPA